MRKKTIAVFLLGLVCGLVLMGGLMRQEQHLAAEAAPQDTVVSAVSQETVVHAAAQDTAVSQPPAPAGALCRSSPDIG